MVGDEKVLSAISEMYPADVRRRHTDGGNGRNPPVRFPILQRDRPRAFAIGFPTLGARCATVMSLVHQAQWTTQDRIQRQDVLLMQPHKPFAFPNWPQAH